MICDMLPRRDTKTPSLNVPSFSCRRPGKRRPARISRRFPATPRPAARFRLVRASMVHSHGRNYSDLNQVANSHKFRQKPQVAGTNTRSAPRRLAPRRPCCLLCSARARSGLIKRQLPCAFRWELGLVAPLLPAAPLFPAFGIAPSPVADIPTEAAGNEERRFHSETAGTPMKLRCENQFG